MQRGFKFGVWQHSVWGGEARGQVGDLRNIDFNKKCIFLVESWKKN